MAEPGTSGKADLGAINRGRLKHPTYGHRPWVIQLITPGFADRVLEGVLAARARREILASIDAVRDKIRRAA